jgi:hypothetical protein
MPTLREELEPLRRLADGGNYAALKAVIEFIDKADKGLAECMRSRPGTDAETIALVRQIAYDTRALLDQQIE